MHTQQRRNDIPASKRRSKISGAMRLIITTTVLFLLVALAIGLSGNWAIALALLLGVGVYASCCLITYATCKLSLLNNASDVRQSAFIALISNRKARYEAAHRHRSEEEFKPFVLPAKSVLTTEEDMNARALLRQVFGEE